MALYLIAVIAYLVALGPEAATVSDAIAASAVSAVLGPWTENRGDRHSDSTLAPPTA
jgi:hypothetical protein